MKGFRFFSLCIIMLLVGLALAAINLPVSGEEQTAGQGLGPYGPTQAQMGAAIFQRRCSTCHGDHGQGLTLEWRKTWDEAHQNCSKSTCHGPDHPPEGFYLPNNYAPALMGEKTLTRFHTAQDLFNFISTKMPYQLPGSLSKDYYWDLAAFLLQGNGIYLTGLNLDATTASQIVLNPGISSISPTLPNQPAVSQPAAGTDKAVSVPVAPRPAEQHAQDQSLSTDPSPAGSRWPLPGGAAFAALILLLIVFAWCIRRSSFLKR